jgi:farnesyl-diphosphate farnesyltransferase
MSKYSHESFEFCRISLKNVSRTFYLNTMVLRKPILEHVMISYLLCRIADTVEDDPKMDDKQKEYGLELFKTLLCTRSDDIDFSKWHEFIKDLEATEAETVLCQNIEKVFELFMSFPSDIKASLRHHITILVDGMYKYISAQKKDKLNQLKDLKELDDYCYYVAGVVGELLASVFTVDSKYISDEHSKVLSKFSVSFGLGLQYVNIIKDAPKDFGRGWTYYPESVFDMHDTSAAEVFGEDVDFDKGYKVVDEMIKNAVKKLDNGVEYTLLLPKRDFTVRIFCLWPLFFAIKTLLKVKENKRGLLEKKTIKINRKTVKFIMFITSALVFSNTLLRLYYRILRKRILR